MSAHESMEQALNTRHASPRKTGRIALLIRRDRVCSSRFVPERSAKRAPKTGIVIRMSMLRTCGRSFFRPRASARP